MPPPSRPVGRGGDEHGREREEKPADIKYSFQVLNSKQVGS